jgi:hypothetical protein
MIAAHFDNLIFLLLLAVALLFQLLARAVGKKNTDEVEPTSKPAPRMPKPIPRAPAESDEERIRKFLEALGQPAASGPPPPVVPRTDIPPRPLAPVRPPTDLLPPWKLTREERRKRPYILKEIASPKRAESAEKIFPPAITGAPAFEVHEGPLPIEPPPIIKAPVEAYAAPKAFGVAKGADFKTDIATLLASKSGLRGAIVLREIFGPPRSLQPLDLVGNT